MNKGDWLSERILFGLLVIAGYLGIVIGTMVIPLLAPKASLPAVQASMGNAKDALLVIGPLLGVIVNAIWKSDKTDKQTADTVNTLASAVSTAMTLPAPDPSRPQPRPAGA